MAILTFKPKQSVKKLLSVLPKRAADIVSKRYGLGTETEKMTLEAIGGIYGITRERVRQIESFALSSIRRSEIFKEESPVFEELRSLMLEMGGIVSEDDFLSSISSDRSVQDHVHVLLVIGDFFTKNKEDEEFHHRWIADPETAVKVHTALRSLYSNLSDKDLVEESKLVTQFLDQLRDVNERYRNEEVASRWLRISKKIGRNPLGEWGMSVSPNINARGMRDYAFLVLRKHGSPMHFREVAKAITEHFEKKAHVATTHNELIKDERFVLVGRGLYALTEWGYASGVVRDVITELLTKHGPLTREEIIEKVLRERYVKENTIIVNLQNSKYFKKDRLNRYSSELSK